MQCKGLELPGYDPRGLPGMLLLMQQAIAVDVTSRLIWQGLSSLANQKG